FVISFVFTAAAFFVVLFASALGRSLVPTDERGSSIWDRVLLGGSVLFAAILCGVGAMNFALADSPTQVTGSALHALNLLMNDSWVFWSARLGSFMLGAAGAWLASARGLRWLGWVALALGIALFIPFADFFAFLASALWIDGVSAMLFLARQEPARVAAPSL